MTNKELDELQKLNTLIRSIDRVLKYGGLMEQTLDDLRDLRERRDNRRQEIVNGGPASFVPPR